MTDEFVTEAQANAITLNELMTTYIDAGFSREEAFEITKLAFQAGMSTGSMQYLIEKLQGKGE
jgi:predicted transcriptional regulator